MFKYDFWISCFADGNTPSEKFAAKVHVFFLSTKFLGSENR